MSHFSKQSWEIPAFTLGMDRGEPKCSAGSFAPRVWALIPESLREVVEPLLELIEQFTRQIRRYEQEIEKLCEEKYPETAGLRQIKGVGALTSLAYILVIEDPHRLSRSRDVGAYLGFTAKLDQSGEQDPQLRITMEGVSQIVNRITDLRSQFLN